MPTDRAYWEEKAARPTLEAADNLFKLVKEIEPNATLKYNKYYIGLRSRWISEKLRYVCSTEKNHTHDVQAAQNQRDG